MIYLDYKTVRYTTKILNYVTETHDHNRHIRHSDVTRQAQLTG